MPREQTARSRLFFSFFIPILVKSIRNNFLAFNISQGNEYDIHYIRHNHISAILDRESVSGRDQDPFDHQYGYPSGSGAEENETTD